MRAIIVFGVLLFVVLASSCQHEKSKSVLTNQKVEIAKPVSEMVEDIISEQSGMPVKQMNYFVVAGCFEYKDNAERLNKSLIQNGFDSQILPFYHLNMVTYGGYATREEAQVALNSMIIEPGKEKIWVYPLK